MVGRNLALAKVGRQKVVEPTVVTGQGQSPFSKVGLVRFPSLASRMVVLWWGAVHDFRWGDGFFVLLLVVDVACCPHFFHKDMASPSSFLGRWFVHLLTPFSGTDSLPFIFQSGGFQSPVLPYSCAVRLWWMCDFEAASCIFDRDFPNKLVIFFIFCLFFLCAGALFFRTDVTHFAGFGLVQDFLVNVANKRAAKSGFTFDGF